LLISIYNIHKEKFNSIKFRNTTVWDIIKRHLHSELQKSGETIVPTKDQIHSKWRNLKRTYIQHVDASNKSGEGKRTPPPYFREIGDILGYKPNVNPQFTIDSSGNKRKKEEKEQEEQDNNNKEIKSPAKKRKMEKKIKIYWMLFQL